MATSRDRHGRGVRGPLALPNSYTGRPVRVPKTTTAAEFFVSCLTASVDRIQRFSPEVLAGVDVGVAEVPTDLLDWSLADDSVPLAMALEASDGRPARVVLFKRPLERRAVDRQELRELVHLTLVEQLSLLTTVPMHQIDPELDDLDG